MVLLRTWLILSQKKREHDWFEWKWSKGVKVIEFSCCTRNWKSSKAVQSVDQSNRERLWAIKFLSARDSYYHRSQSSLHLSWWYPNVFSEACGVSVYPVSILIIRFLEVVSILVLLCSLLLFLLLLLLIVSLLKKTIVNFNIFTKNILPDSD